MNWKEFFIELLKLASFDAGVGFVLYISWKYVDMKYFSKLELHNLLEENKYLKEQNKKIHGSSEFWNEEDL